MKNLYPIFLFSLASCTHQMVEAPLVTELPVKRQKQKLIVLEKKLESAERQQLKIAREVDALKEEIEEVELAIIRKVLEGCEVGLSKQHVVPANLFLTERETLHKLIQSGPSKVSFEAQVVLDQILRIITNLSE